MSDVSSLKTIITPAVGLFVSRPYLEFYVHDLRLKNKLALLWTTLVYDLRRRGLCFANRCMRVEEELIECFRIPNIM